MWRLQPTFRAKKTSYTNNPNCRILMFSFIFFVVVVATVCYSKTISLWFWLHELVCVRPHKWPQKCLSIFFYINCGQYSINLNYITVKLIGTGFSAMRSKCAAHCSIPVKQYHSGILSFEFDDECISQNLNGFSGVGSNVGSWHLFLLKKMTNVVSFFAHFLLSILAIGHHQMVDEPDHSFHNYKSNNFFQMKSIVRVTVKWRKSYATRKRANVRIPLG